MLPGDIKRMDTCSLDKMTYLDYILNRNKLPTIGSSNSRLINPGGLRSQPAVLF